MTDQALDPKAFVTEDEETVIVCPNCSTAKNMSVRQFRHRMHLLKIKCRCGHAFRVQLEFRRHFRKPTTLNGTFEPGYPAGSLGATTIVNLSLSGACFEMRGIHDLRIGQKGVLVFTLDNRKKTVLSKTIQIRSINGNRIGGEFITDRAFDKDLGFYLRM